MLIGERSSGTQELNAIIEARMPSAKGNAFEQVRETGLWMFVRLQKCNGNLHMSYTSRSLILDFSAKGHVSVIPRLAHVT